jgi:hypothetical protein
LKNNKNLSISILFALFALSLCTTSYSFKNNSNTLILHPTINSNDSFEIKGVVEPIPAYDPTPPYYSLNETVVLIIENSLWGISAVQTAVNQYEQDLKDTGYTTIKHTNSISTVQNLKSLLQSWYTNNNSIGAVLIGNLPYAQYYHPAVLGTFNAETFTCDLYLMDMDGNWWDLNTDGVYDKHNASTGADIYPEIYVGRIDATNRGLGGQTNSQNIITLLNRIHSYRIGGVSRTHRAITYIDDDWQAWANGTYDNWPGWLDNAYSTRTDVHTPTTATTANDWLNTRLLQDYEFAHLCVHSGVNPGQHYFGPRGSGEGTVSSSQIHTKINAPAFNFYNLFCCHGADWSTWDCLATTYLYSGSRSISVLGSTKTGGMTDGTTFYDSLGNNMTFGKALHDWYQSMTTYSGNYVEWFYGMSILGDPFSTIHFDCTVLTPKIFSFTHPSSSWSANALPSFNWTKPSDVNGIAGYYYIIDQNPTTIPTSSTGIFTKYTGALVSSSLSDGSWYVHVVAKDNVGNIGNAADHYQVNIDTTGPVLSLTSPVPYYNSSINSISLIWSATDSLSGYGGTAIWLDSPSNNVYSGTLQNTIISSLTEGIHVINITVLDYVMNINSLQFLVHIDLTNPMLNLLSPLNQSNTKSVVQFNWNVMEGETGYKYTEIFIDNILKSTVNAPLMSTTISNLNPGQHTANITVYDWSGRSNSIIMTFTVEPPAIPGYPDLFITISVLTMIGITLVWRKRFRFLFK